MPASSTDPGSDDLTFTWDWDDGSTSTQTSLVNPPALDPAKSPSVQPRLVTLEQAHTYVEACIYELTVTVEDDDGGTASDTAAVVVTGNATMSRSKGWWLNQYRVKPGNDFTTPTLECYLAIAGYFSLVFPDGMVRADGELILHDPPKSSPLVQSQRGAPDGLAELREWGDRIRHVGEDRIRTATRRSEQAMLAAELVATNPASTAAQIHQQKVIINKVCPPGRLSIE